MTQPRRAFLALLLAALAACSAETEAPPKAAVPVKVLSAADVTVARVSTVRESVPLNATLSALSTSELAAQGEGRVQAVAVREGERVRRGQLLARVDAQLLAEAVREQEAQLANEQARLELARVKLEKQRELYRQGFISALAIAELESDYKVREGSLAAQAAQLARARRALTDSEIRSPIDGVLFRRSVNPGDSVSRNQKLFAVADLSVLEAVAAVPARRVSAIAPGQKAWLSVEGGAPVWGQVVRVNPVANEGSRSFNVYVRIDNRDGRLKAGQFAKGAVVLAERSDRVALPASALSRKQGAASVLVVEGGVLKARPVTPLLEDEANAQVALDGVRAGERVLLLQGLHAGERVTLAAGG